MNTKTLVPIAILVSGLLIAGAILWGTTQTDPAGIQPADLGHNPEQMMALIDSAGAQDRTLGNPDAPITLIEYSDTECPFCQQYHETVLEIMEKHGPSGTLAWEYRHVPFHRKAPAASAALECMREIGGSRAFWIGLDTIMHVSPGNDRFDLAQLPAIAELAGVDRDDYQECADSGRYDDDIQDFLDQGRADGVTGTPFSIMEVTEPVSDEVRAAITALDEELAASRDIFTVNDEGTRISFSGALPFGMLDQLITIIQGTTLEAEEE